MYKKIIPKTIKDSIKVLMGRAKAVPLSDTSVEPEDFKHSCPVCSSPIKQFNRLPDFYHENLDKHGYIFSVFQSETINRLNYSCPSCGASDRCRLYSLYFQKEIPVVQDGFRILDIAPSKSLANFIKKNIQISIIALPI